MLVRFSFAGVEAVKQDKNTSILEGVPIGLSYPEVFQPKMVTGVMIMHGVAPEGKCPSCFWQCAAMGKHRAVLKGAGRWQPVSLMDSETSIFSSSAFLKLYLRFLSTCRARGWLETLAFVSFLTEADAKCPLNRCITVRSKICQERWHQCNKKITVPAGSGKLLLLCFRGESMRLSK